MSHTHRALIEKIHEVCEADSRVLAAWLEGSIARKEDDDLSDIDLWVSVADSDFDEFIEERETFAAKIGPVLSVLYPKTPRQPDDLDSFQVLFDDQAITCHLDVDVQKQSREFTFTKGSAAEECKILFDRDNIIQYSPLDTDAVEEYVHSVFEYSVTQFWHRLPHVLVLVERGNLLAAMQDYRARLEDLVTLYRILYTPEKVDWGWTDADAELPPDALRTLADCTPELSEKSLRKCALRLAKAFDKQSHLLSKRLHSPLPSALTAAVMEIF
jgi:predicted nucleotidyltransferase